MSVGRAAGNLEKIFKALIEAFEKAKIPYMVVGGLAANYYGMPRATFDLDLVIEIGLERTRAVTNLLRELNFVVRTKDVEQIVSIGNRIMVNSRNHPYRVDLWLIKSLYDREAFKRRRKGHLWGHTIWMISPEDLILSKIKAGRAKDIEDTIGILKLQKDHLDGSYLSDWAKRLNIIDELRRLKRSS